MMEELHVCDERLKPALILTSGLAQDVLGATDESYPEGSCFFINESFVATARHSGEMLRSDLLKEGVRPKDGIQPYGLHVLDPRLELTWRVLNEVQFSLGDVSLLPVVPVVEEDEDASPFLPWCEVLRDQMHPEFPVVRMFPVQDGEVLTLRGFTDIEFEYSQPNDDRGRLVQGVSATGILGTGPALWQNLETFDGPKKRLTIDGIAAKGQNSGGPIMDSENRLVGVVSLSPQGGYTVVSTFFQDCDRPDQGGRHMTRLTLQSEEGTEAELCLLYDFGP